LAARGVKTKRHTSKSHYEPSDAAIRKTVQLVHAEAKRILAENPNLDWEEAEHLAIQSVLAKYGGPSKSARGKIEWVDTPRGRRLRVVTASGWVDWPIMYSDGRIAYEFPERVPEYLKKEVRSELSKSSDKSDFLFYTDEDLESIKRSLAKERTFTSLGHDMAKKVEMSQDEAMRILEEWGEVLNPADYSIPIKMARDPKKWYTHAKHTGWRKTQQASTRRAKLLASTPKNWTSARRYGLAGRRAQALANVTQDKQTARLADADAQYFFDKLARLRA
jgi:hypothetical protein